jgi:DeoR family transcriptional regulator, glycerol-3-phosphate regulon repressor
MRCLLVRPSDGSRRCSFRFCAIQFVLAHNRAARKMENRPRATRLPRYAGPVADRPLAPNPRQAELLEAVKAHGSLTVESLSERFGVTLQTVRRDITLLAEAGLLARFHGGARLPSSTTENIAYRERQRMNDGAKRAIARAVAARVPDGCSIIVNIGTTTEAVARELLHRKGLRVITNNLNVAAILADKPDFEVIVTGGVVRSRDRGVVGEAAVEFIRQFRVDIGLIGISGLEADGTLRDFDYREVKVARAIIAQSRQVWLAADHSKFNRPAMVEVAPLSAVDMLFTDAPMPPPFGALCAEAGVDAVIAPAEAVASAPRSPRARTPDRPSAR